MVGLVLFFVFIGSVLGFFGSVGALKRRGIPGAKLGEAELPWVYRTTIRIYRAGKDQPRRERTHRSPEVSAFILLALIIGFFELLFWGRSSGNFEIKVLMQFLIVLPLVAGWAVALVGLELWLTKRWIPAKLSRSM